LVTVSFACGSISAQAKDAPLPKPFWQKSIEGRGDNEESAKRDALREAAKLAEGLRQQQKPFFDVFAINEENVGRFLQPESSKAGDDLKIKLGEKEEIFKTWVINLRTDTDRTLRAEERSVLAGCVTAFLALVVAIGFGYVRIDEYTRQRYTTILRIAGAGILAVVLAGAWFFFQSW
jgi:hypothetical protein